MIEEETTYPVSPSLHDYMELTYIFIHSYDCYTYLTPIGHIHSMCLTEVVLTGRAISTFIPMPVSVSISNVYIYR